MIKCAGGRIFAGVLSDRWPPVATLAGCRAPAGTLTIRITEDS